MPNIKSAIKRVKTDSVRRICNRARKSSIRTLEKNFLVKIENKDQDSAKSLLSTTASLYDKAAKVGTLHKNQANRKKSRLTAVFIKTFGKQP